MTNYVSMAQIKRTAHKVVEGVGKHIYTHSIDTEWRQLSPRASGGRLVFT